MSRVETQSSRGRLQPGQRVGDHLVVRSVLGQGGTAVVYEALHTRLGASVALKVLDVPDSFLEDGKLRMQREAEVCASIDDPHVPRIYDINELPDGTPYVVMEKVSGSTLEEMLAKGPLTLDTVLAIADDLMAALEAVHRVGVIHRDIKPANLILKSEADGCYRVRLMDFGVSKSVCREPTDPKLTRVGTVVGTPHYMAPEQITGEVVDARVDVYACGVVLFEMLSGRMPFEGESTAEVVAAVLRHTPLALTSLRPDVPSQLEGVVMRAMAPRANARYLTVRDMRCALAQCGAAQHSASRPSALSLVPAPRGFEAQADFPEFELRPASHAGSTRTATRRYSILGAGLAVLVGTVGFPRAAKHVSMTELTPAQVAKAEVEQPPRPIAAAAIQQHVAPVAAVPVEAAEPVAVEAAAPVEAEPIEADEPSSDTAVLNAPRYRLDLPTQHLQIAVSPEVLALPQVEATAPAQAGEPGIEAREQRKNELSEEQRAARDEERRARRRLRQAEEALSSEREVEPGVLIQDYLQQIEAIQREANDSSGALPDAIREAPAAPPTDDLPPNPYPN